MAPTDVRWVRIAAFALGILGVYGYLRANPFASLPAPLAVSLASIPVMLLAYSVTDRSWRTAIVSGLGVGVGMAVGTALG